MDRKNFNVRVYGFILSRDSELLIAEEFHYDTFMRKLPGGGLQFGEGTLDCLRRELLEELGVAINELRHFHTTDFFIQSKFNPDQQVIGIYYIGSAPDELHDRHRENYELPSVNGTERFRWVPLRELSPGDFTFEVDRRAAEKFLRLAAVDSGIKDSLK